MSKGPVSNGPDQTGDTSDLPGRYERWLILLLRGVAVITWLAFLAAVMPEKWIVEISEELGFDPFPHSPLTFYLARNLSLLYGMVGAGLWLITFDFDRYQPLIKYFALGTIAFGALQLVVDFQASMPIWWTLGESVSTMLGGMLVGWLDRKVCWERANA